MSDPFSELEPGDLVELPAGYVVAPLRHPLLRWEEEHGNHYAYLGDHLVTVVRDYRKHSEVFAFRLDNCFPNRADGRPKHRDEFYEAKTLKRAKHRVETMVEKWVTAAGLMAAQTVYYTKPTDETTILNYGGMPGIVVAE